MAGTILRPLRMWGRFNPRDALTVGRPCLIANMAIDIGRHDRHGDYRHIVEGGERPVSEQSMMYCAESSCWNAWGSTMPPCVRPSRWRDLPAAPSRALLRRSLSEQHGRPCPSARRVLAYMSWTWDATRQACEFSLGSGMPGESMFRYGGASDPGRHGQCHAACVRDQRAGRWSRCTCRRGTVGRVYSAADAGTMLRAATFTWHGLPLRAD